MSFTPKSIIAKANPAVVLATYTDEAAFKFAMSEGFDIVEASGVQIHPFHVKVGDVIGFNQTGFSKAKVVSIELNESSLSVDGLYLSGYYRFTVEGGFRSIGFDGIKVHTPLYKFIE